MNRTLAWLLSIIAAVAALGLVGMHMGFVKVNYLLLVALCLYHGFFGLHTMLTEVWSGSRAGWIITGSCLVLGVGLFALTLATALVA